MSNFQLYTNTGPLIYPDIDLTAQPGLVYDFGTKPVPTDGHWSASAGPATGQFDSLLANVPSNVVTKNPRFTATSSGAPTSGSYSYGDIAIDDAGNLYRCVTAGTPGTWVAGTDSVATLNATYSPLLMAASYTYNADGTVATETVGGLATTYTYNADGTVHTVTRNGVTVTYTYNADGTVAGAA